MPSYSPLTYEVRAYTEDCGRPIGEVRAVVASLSAAGVSFHPVPPRHRPPML